MKPYELDPNGVAEIYWHPAGVRRFKIANRGYRFAQPPG